MCQQWKGKQSLERLKCFAIVGHQIVLNAWCCTSSNEVQGVERAICAQRVAAAVKRNSGIGQAKAAASEEAVETARKLKKVRIDMAKCKRVRVRAEDAKGKERQTAEEGCQGVVEYGSRVFVCPKCGKGKETRGMHLRTQQGFKGFHCKQCKHHARCGWYECTCKRVWHHCTFQRADPIKHKSSRPQKSERAANVDELKPKLSMTSSPVKLSCTKTEETKAYGGVPSYAYHE